MKNSPIGFFDSGVGGTSIWKETIKLLPYENTIYLADSINAPYGQKSQEEIIKLSEKNTKFLIDKGAKLIVVACNTATTNAIDYLRSKYSIPFIGIEPAIKPAALQTQTNTVGILATAGTLSSELFAKTSAKFASNIRVVEQIGEGLVPLIENNQLKNKDTTSLLQKYLTPMIKEGIDHLILGCTHYPYLIPQIKKIIGDKVIIIDSGYAVSKQIERVLTQLDLRNPKQNQAQHSLYINTEATALKNLLYDVIVPFSVIQQNF
jgi:glutamate racemase